MTSWTRGMGREAIADYIHPAKYARYLPELKRRETYSETVDRVRNMHVRRYPHLATEIHRVFDDFVLEKRVLPSMRSMQFGGLAIEKNNCRLYNCTFSLCDRIGFFHEAFYLLLCGCGVGFSVQKRHVKQLPRIGTVSEQDHRVFLVPDSIEGWAEALRELFKSVLDGYHVAFDYSAIEEGHPKGAPLITSGGRAPGPEPLREALEKIRRILYRAAGRQLRPIECLDIMCIAADAVLSGGIRRSAMIALFSEDDEEMLKAKTGLWYERYPWRARSNNSVALLRHKADRGRFDRVFNYTKEWGEPGVYFLPDLDYGSNPCGEIGLNPLLRVTAQNLTLLKRHYSGIRVGDHLTGWSFCNLSEINAAKFESWSDMVDASRAAALLGTIQAGYTDFPYLGIVSELICRRESLLGVSMTGMVDRPDIAFNPDLQQKAARVVIEENARVAQLIGIPTAARGTCIKPSGTASLELGCVGAGIGTHHSARYFRRIIANKLEPVYRHFQMHNPHMCEPLDSTNDIITFPVSAPEGAITRKDLSASEFLDTVLSTQQNWVLPGTTRPKSSPGLTHNVSNTVSVRDSEWGEVRDKIWKNRQFFSGVSMLADVGDKAYANAPREAVVSDNDEMLWRFYTENYQPVDYTTMVEETDVTNRQGELACAGGSCDF